MTTDYSLPSKELIYLENWKSYISAPFKNAIKHWLFVERFDRFIVLVWNTAFFYELILLLMLLRERIKKGQRLRAVVMRPLCEVKL